MVDRFNCQILFTLKWRRLRWIKNVIWRFHRDFLVAETLMNLGGWVQLEFWWSVHPLCIVPLSWIRSIEQFYNDKNSAFKIKIPNEIVNSSSNILNCQIKMKKGCRVKKSVSTTWEVYMQDGIWTNEKKKKERNYLSQNLKDEFCYKTKIRLQLLIL
jgi:hypothetical protein